LLPLQFLFFIFLVVDSIQFFLFFFIVHSDSSRAQEKLGLNFRARASAFASRSFADFLFGSRRASVCACKK
jgi:hypothetical protein